MAAAAGSPIAATRIAADDSRTPDGALVMLHGIFGRGRNWLGIARTLVASRPDYACWLVDLPHHGDSGPGTHGDTVAGLAADVEGWLERSGVAPTAVLGHSYGGKVTLALAADPSIAARQFWVIDSTPEVKPASGSAWDMLQLIDRLPRRFPSRESAIDAIIAGGFAHGVAQWMATNLVRDGDGFVWRIDVEVMRRLLLDFFGTDLWHVLSPPRDGREIRFVKASQSSAMSQLAVDRIAALGDGRVILHHLEGGHWIHAESPALVTRLLIEHLPSI